MKKVFKYPLPVKLNKFPLVLPRGFKFLRVGFQNDELMMWCEVSDGAPKDTINFQVFGTGHEISDGMKYLASYDVGPFVLHLYQVG